MSWLHRFRAFYFGITPTEMRQRDCSHTDVEWTYIEPITLLPKEGKCRWCNKHVKATITWD